jgi:aspartyl protease family protein
MLKLAAIAIAGVLSAAVCAQMLGRISEAHEPGQLRQAQSVATPDASNGASSSQVSGPPASIVKAADGHFWADADVNGHQVHFLVDTGATTVALTPDDALRLGFEPASLSYAYQVTTASGPARAARVHLDSISVAGAEVQNVDAMVIEKGLPTSLLGMTYLGRLSQFEATQSGMILRP